MAVPEVFQRGCARNGWPCEGNQAEIALEGGRKQKVLIDIFRHENDAMARAYTVIGSADALSETRLRSALGLNFGLAHGALAVHDEQLVMTDTFLVKDADEDEVDASLRFLAATADRYEKLIYGGDAN